MSSFDGAIILTTQILHSRELWLGLLLLFPYVLLVELPYYLFVIIACLKNLLQQTFKSNNSPAYFPLVSCIVCGYNEGAAIQRSLQSLLEQRYPGRIEILLIIDGASVNQGTFAAARAYAKAHSHNPRRIIRVIPKYIRGGHASSLNLGLKLAKGEYVMTLDGDSSCDNTLLSNSIANFLDPHVSGISGAIRVRNAKKNLLTRLQAVEYLLSINLARQGLGACNVLNIISGAFGVYRTQFLKQLQGWKNGSAEDLDLTVRMQAYFHSHQNLKLSHDSQAVIHTDAPETLRGLLKQRLRWDGDSYYIYCRRHWRTIRPKFLGWRLFLTLIWSGLLLQIVMPLTLIPFTLFILTQFSFAYVLSIFTIAYCYYLLVGLILYGLYLTMISERKWYDLSFMPFLVLMPIYQFVMRIWTGIAVLYEIVMKTHQDSSMAPWWVIRKTH
jgi:cellulose synthase/poly-beta-1,6-N-acetylglucosamine synthase-like glycosyltransferase